MRPNVEFRVELPKTNPGLAKSHFQQETRSYAQKPPLTTGQNFFTWPDLTRSEKYLTWIQFFDLKQKRVDPWPDPIFLLVNPT